MIRPKAGSFKRETVQCDKTNCLAACADAQIPMLFLQGTRDEFANLELLQPLTKQLGAHAALKLFQDADHSFHVPARTGRKDAQVRSEMLDALTEWIDAVKIAGL